MFSFLCYIILSFSCFTPCRSVHAKNSLVFGPGIENNQFHMPVRYFFVRLIDTDGKNLTNSPGRDYLSAKTLNHEHCRAWFQIIDAHDGSFVIRYKLYHTCAQLYFELKTKDGDHVADSPYFIEGPLYNDDCYCPKPFDIWSKVLKCPNEGYEQIDSDLSRFPLKSINFSSVLKDAKERWAVHPGAYSFCHYVIIDNKINRHCYGQHVGFKMFSDAILLSLTRKVILPDTEFLINLGDWPLVKKDFLLPLFSWCGSEDTNDIVLPTYDMTESTLEMMGRHSLDVFTVQGMNSISWHLKQNKSYWRGRDSRQERLNLVHLSRQNPALIDAGITRFFFFLDVMKNYGPEVPTVSFEEFFKYKYLINIDGTVAAYRLPYLLAGNSLVFKHDSIYYEHFYKSLQPWVHYVPIKKDLSDLIEKLIWAQEHDIEAENISKNAQNFIKSNLLPADIFCYYAIALREYTNRLIQGPENVHLDMEHVAQSKDSYRCKCESSTLTSKIEL